MKPNQFTNLLPSGGTLTQDGQEVLAGVYVTRIKSAEASFDSICFSRTDGDAYNFILSMISIPAGATPMQIESGKIIPIGKPSSTCVRGLLVSFPHKDEAELGFKFSEVTEHFCAQ